MQVIVSKVGAPWPFSPLPPGGTRAEVHHHANELFIVLGIDLGDFTRFERDRLLSDHVGVRIVLCRSLLLFLVTTTVANFDLPFAAAINGSDWHSDLMSALQFFIKC